MTLPLAVALLTALSARAADLAPVVRGQVDWQGHLAMHLAWPIYGRGLTDREPDPTWDHTLRQTVSEPSLRASGVRIFLTAAIAAERARNPVQARRLILKQLAFIQEFVAENPDHYALAATPEQARELLTTTDKMVLVHSIEGGKLLLSGPEDARFWADQGVALITLIHLQDDELGGAAINPGWLGPRLNRAGAKKRAAGASRGLTERGRAAVAELGDAGILVDLTHMSPQAVAETLEITAARGMPPVVTHGKLASLTRDERALPDDQVVEIYRQGGSFNLILNGGVLNPVAPSRPVPAGLCPSTLDSFQLHHQAVQALLLERAADIFGADALGPGGLDPDQQVALATGWASDWNGWTVHSQPKTGPGHCEPFPPDAQDFDRYGLAHPGLLPQHWARLAQQGTDLAPMQYSAEQFLRIWERARAVSAHTMPYTGTPERNGARGPLR